jgi:excisionase family DNA binding protein
MTRHLSIARPAADAGADALRALAIALAPYLVGLLTAERAEAEIVDVAAAVPLPRRTIYRACRRGHIHGAARVGRKWLASRGAVDAWLRACGPRALPSPDDDEDDLESVRRSLSTPGRRRRTG